MGMKTNLYAQIIFLKNYINELETELKEFDKKHQLEYVDKNNKKEREYMEYNITYLKDIYSTLRYLNIPDTRKVFEIFK